MAVGGGVIGALRVVLGADTAAFETGLKKSASSLDKFAANAKKAGIAIAGAMTVAAIGLGMAIKGTLDEADKLGKMAQSIGVPVEELSKLKHAADLSGVSLESLSKGVGRLNRNIVEGAQGLSTPIRAFEALGISIRNTDGSLKTVSQALPEIADKFAQMRDGPEKTALAMQLLGRAGADLIPMLNLGKAGLNEMMREAEALGLVIDTKTAKAAEEFNDNLTRLRRVFDGMITQVTAQLAPALAMFSGALVTLAKNSDNAKTFASGLVTVIKGAVEVAYAAAVIFRRLGAELAAFWEVLKSDNLANTKKVWAEFQAEGEKTKAALAAIPEVLAKFWSDAETEAQKYSQTATGTAQVAIQSQDAITQKLKEQKDAAREATRAWEQMWAEGNRIWEQTRTPLEQFNAEVQRLNELLQQGVITSDTYGRAIAQLQDSFTGASQYANQFLGSLEGAFVSAVAGGEKLSEVAKKLLSDFARLAAQMAFRSLLGGFGNLFGGGGGGFKLPGFASGGSFQVGGSGGIDSQLVAFKASPNERVTVSKPGQGVGGGPTVVVQQTNHFASGITGTDRAWIEASLAQNKEQTKQETIGLIRERRETDSGYI